jgi:hypothetical protein
MPMTFAGSDDDPEFGIRLSRMINEGYADLIAMHPDRFGAFATLPADGPDEALAELAYALDELRLDGVTLTSNVLGRYFGHPPLEPVLAELAQRGVPVFVHPVDCPHIDVLGFGRPSSIVEFPFDTAQHHQRPVHRCLPATPGVASDPGALRRGVAHPRVTDRRTATTHSGCSLGWPEGTARSTAVTPRRRRDGCRRHRGRRTSAVRPASSATRPPRLQGR